MVSRAQLGAAVGEAQRPSERRSLAETHAWIDANLRAVPPEDVPLADLAGRVLAGDVVASADEPPAARAAIDGLALRAAEAVGASAYNPLPFTLWAPGQALPPHGAALLGAGDPLPTGADTVAPLDYVSLADVDRCELIEAVPPGHEVEGAGSQIARGSTIFPAGHRVTAADLGLLALAGLDRVAVVRRPRVALVLAADPIRDSDGPMLDALIARDGGDVATMRRVGRDRAALRRAFHAQGCDAIVTIGGTGRGPDDHVASVLSEVGTVAIDGVALHPGGTAAIGRTSHGACVLLLPGRPAACLWAYELVAGRALRQLAGRDPALPFARRSMTLARKIVSQVGVTEVCPVRLAADGRAETVTAFARDGLMALSQADGFVVIPEGSEGFAAGAAVPVYLLRSA